ncbi:MAG: hypothetical protein QX189_10415 [Methylococcales bacterium]
MTRQVIAFGCPDLSSTSRLFRTEPLHNFPTKITLRRIARTCIFLYAFATKKRPSATAIAD